MDRLPPQENDRHVAMFEVAADPHEPGRDPVSAQLPAGVDALQRWLLSGGHWELLGERDGEATVALMTCDGGQEMDRVVVPVESLPSR